jgi:hypothetical protein
MVPGDTFSSSVRVNSASFPGGPWRPKDDSTTLCFAVVVASAVWELEAASTLCRTEETVTTVLPGEETVTEDLGFACTSTTWTTGSTVIAIASPLRESRSYS